MLKLDIVSRSILLFVFKVCLCVGEAVTSRTRTERAAPGEGAVGACPAVILLLERGTSQTVTADVPPRRNGHVHDHVP